MLLVVHAAVIIRIAKSSFVNMDVIKDSLLIVMVGMSPQVMGITA